MRIRPQIKLNFILFILGLTAIVLMVFLWPRGAKAGVPVIGTPTANVDLAKTLNKYQMLEFAIPLSATYDNPYRSDPTNETYTDSNQTQTGYGITLDALIKTPSGQTVTVPGFYNVDYTTPMSDPNSTTDIFAVSSGGRWNVRYAGTEVGTYQYCFKVSDKNGKGYYPSVNLLDSTKCALGSSHQFSVSSTADPSAPHGFLRQSTKNPGFFEYDDGTPYVQLGVSTDTRSVQEYPSMKENGFNFSRVWLTNGAQSTMFRSTADNTWLVTLPTADNLSPSIIRKYSSTANRTGKQGFETDLKTAVSSGNTIARQKNIGSLPNSCYMASAYVKTTNNFNGSLAFNASGTSLNLNSGTITGIKDWTLLTVGPFKTASNGLTITLSTQLTQNASAGSIYMDDVSLYQTTLSNGACTTTHAYTPSEVNLVWDSGFEYAEPHSMGNPSTFNVENLARFDFVLKKAEANGVLLQPSIFDYKVWGNSPSVGSDGLWVKNENSNWAQYYAGNVSDLSGSGNDFWDTSSNEYKSEKYALRYIIARYGYSPSIGLWELTNEMKPGPTTEQLNWIKTTSDYIKTLDYNHRLVTNSYWNGFGGSSVSDPSTTGIDVLTRHNYIYDEITTSHDGTEPAWGTLYKDEINWASYAFDYYKKNGYGSAFLTNLLGLSGEWGVLSNTPSQHNSHWVDLTEGYVSTEGLTSAQASIYCQSDGTNCDTNGIVFHNSLWSDGMLLGFKNILNVFSDELLFNDVYGSNWLKQGKAISTFSKNLPFYNSSSEIVATSDVSSNAYLADLASGSNISISPASSTNTNIRVLGRKSGDQAFLWVQNSKNIWGNRIQSKQSITNQSGDLTISGFSKGKQFNVSLFNTYNGVISETRPPITSDSNGNLIIKSISLGTDTNPSSALTSGRPDVGILITSTDNSRPNITVTKKASLASGSVGDRITYSFVVDNTGSSKALNVNVADPIPTSLNFISADNGGSFSNGKVTWVLDLDVGAEKTVSFLAEINSN